MRGIWAVPIIVSILIIGTLVLSQDAFAPHNDPTLIVTPDRQSGPINQLQTFTVEFSKTGIVDSSILTITCDPPIQTNFNPNIVRFEPEQFTVNSNTPGIVICEAKVVGQGRATGESRLREFVVISDFVPLFNSLALATCEEDLGVCEEDLGVCEEDLGVCEGERDAFEFDLGVCEEDLGVCEGERDAFEFDLGVCEEDFDDLLAILLSGEITICHNEKKTLTIGLDAFGTHAGHGDTIGSCE